MAEKPAESQEFYFVKFLEGIEDPNFCMGVWCENKGLDENGRVKGYVLNGGWMGSFTPTSCIVEGTDDEISGHIVWIGNVPCEYSTDYNEAIDWIVNQVKERIKK